MQTNTTPPFHRIGYARVSSTGQNMDSQIDALQKAGCGKIFSDKMTGSHMDRPGWDQLLEYARPGDTLVVSELSRMTRSLMDLLTTAKVLEQRQIILYGSSGRQYPTLNCLSALVLRFFKPVSRNVLKTAHSKHRAYIFNSDELNFTYFEEASSPD